MKVLNQNQKTEQDLPIEANLFDI